MIKVIAAITDLQESIEISREGIKAKEKELVVEILNYRREHGITQRELARRMRISPGYMADLELGRRKFSKKILDKLYDL